MDETAARRAFEKAMNTYTHDFETFFLCRLFGLAFNYAGDKLVIDFPLHDFMYNPQGGLHGGVSAFILDVAMGHLLWRTLGTPGSTLELKTQYLSPVRGSKGSCEAMFLRKGKTICFLEARLLDETGAVAVVATSTWRVGSSTSKKKSTPSQGQRATP